MSDPVCMLTDGWPGMDVGWYAGSADVYGMRNAGSATKESADILYYYTLIPCRSDAVRPHRYAFLFVQRRICEGWEGEH